MKNFESFRTEEELVRRIAQLRAVGIEDKEMHVVSTKEIDGDLFDYSDISLEKNNEVSLGDKIAAFFTGEEPAEVAFDRFGFDENTKSEIVSSVRNGNYVLVVDREGYYEILNF